MEVRCTDAAQPAEARDQRLGERFDIAARDGPEQRQLQQLVIGQTLSARFRETRPQPVAMTGMMRGRRGLQGVSHGGLANLLFA